MKKTIFIIVTRSMITRNILRSGTLALLKKAGWRIVIFFDSDKVPARILDEFEDEHVVVHACRTVVGRIHRRFMALERFLIDTKTTRLLARYHASRVKRQQHKNLPKKPRFIIAMRLAAITFFSRLPLVKKLYRLIDFYLFPEKDRTIRNYFDVYAPDVVFSTSVLSALDIAFMKEAKRRKTKTLSMQKGWDNLMNVYYRFAPDFFCVPTEMNVDLAVAFQDMRRERISVIGFPQFDWYSRRDIIRNKAEHWRSKGLDPQKAVIFFGSEGLWSTSDHVLAEEIYGWIQRNELAKPSQLFIRPHYSNVTSDVFRDLKHKPGVVVDGYRTDGFMIDAWDPSVPETADFTNSVVHCDVMINIASTLSLDAACAHRPIINIGFGCVFQDGKDISSDCLYSSDHYQWVLATRGVVKVDSVADLKEQINSYLLHPERDASERRLLRDRLCYLVDGQSSARLAQVIHTVTAA